MKIKTKSIYFCFSIILLTAIFLGSPQNVSAETVINGGKLYGNLVWTKDNSPYIISGASEITSTSTLTIEKGTIVKFKASASLKFSGQVSINGADDDLVYFTSFYDDQFGGDSDGQPNYFGSQYNEWSILFYNNRFSNTISNLSIRYCTYGITIDNSKLTGRNIRIPPTPYSYGITSLRSSESDFSNLFVYSGEVAILLGSSSKMKISSSTIRVGFNDSTGIMLDSNSSLTLASSTVTNGASGSGLIMYRSSADISSSTFSGAWAGDGIALYSASYGTTTIPSFLKIRNSSIFNYDNGNGISVNNSVADIQSTELTKNSTGIKILGDVKNGTSTVSVHNSRIYDNYESGLVSNNLTPVSAENNWWGDASGPKNQSQNPSGLGNAVSDGVDFVPWLAYDPSLPPPPEPVKKTPVLIVPGILGVDMLKDDNKLWVDLDTMKTDVGDEFMNPLAFNFELKPIDNQLVTGEIIRIATGTPEFLLNYDYTDGLIKEFKSSGYTEGNTSTSTLFTFPYDWRYGASGIFSNGKTNIDILRQKIEEIRTLTRSDKVDIIAHSTGGLLVKKYAMDYPSDNHIDKAIFVGVPNLGAPKATKVLLEGDNFNIPFLSSDEMKKISENLPVSYDLAPSKEYTDRFGSYFSITTYGPGTASKIENLNFTDLRNLLSTGFNLNSQGLSNSENFHSESFDNFDIRTAGVDLYSIVGCKSGTIGKINEIKNDRSEHLLFTLTETTGDGTVPAASANSLAINDNNVFYAIKPDHGKMLSSEGIRQKIVNIVASTTLNVGTKILTQADLFNNPFKCQLSGRLFEIFSPLAIEIIDQNGNRSGIAEDGSIQNDIPGADYQIMGEHKFVFVPTDENQTYTINLKGTGNGVFTLKDQTIFNDIPTQTIVWGNVPVTTNSVGQITVGNGEESISTLSFDTNGDGQIKTIQPSIISEGNSPDDFIPPVITINSPESKDYLRSDTITINATSTDIGTGVFSFGLAFDNKQVKNGDMADLFYEKLGNHSLTASSTDFVNNLTTSTINFRIIATPESAIYDVERAYSLGWLKNKNAKNSLINKLKAAIRIDKKIETIEEKLNGKKVVKRIEKFEKRIDKILVRLLLTELKLYKNGKILSDQGYQILSEDINWLINN
ncbi:MAG: hypothetical protein WCT19_00235 [Candidatus Paceibacterota bacterium]